MPTGLTYKIAEGEATSTIEIIESMMTGFNVACHDDGKLRPLCVLEKQLRRQVTEAEKDLQEAIDGLEELTAKSNEDLVTERIAMNREHHESLVRYHAEKDQLIGRYTAAEAKLIAWEVPPSLEDMKAGMLKHLREDLEYERRHRTSEQIDREIPHGFEIREERIEYYENEIARLREKVAEAKRGFDLAMEFYRDLHASLDQLRADAKKMPPA